MLDHFAVLKGVTVQRERRELVEALLRQVNLWDVRKRKLGTFSGGMRQRFGIAQALIGDPKLVIVDEPTAGLDPEERNRFLNLLAEIGERVVVILSTHIVEDVTDLCPRMAIIGQGQVLLSGEPLEAIRSLEGRVWRCTIDKAELDSYRARMNILSTRLMAGRTQIHVLADSQPGEGFVGRGARSGRRLFRPVARTGHGQGGLTARRASAGRRRPHAPAFTGWTPCFSRSSASNGASS